MSSHSDEDNQGHGNGGNSGANLNRVVPLEEIPGKIHRAHLVGHLLGRNCALLGNDRSDDLFLLHGCAEVAVPTAAWSLGACMPHVTHCWTISLAVAHGASLDRRLACAGAEQICADRQLLPLRARLRAATRV